VVIGPSPRTRCADKQSWGFAQLPVGSAAWARLRTPTLGLGDGDGSSGERPHRLLDDLGAYRSGRASGSASLASRSTSSELRFDASSPAWP